MYSKMRCPSFWLLLCLLTSTACAGLSREPSPAEQLQAAAEIQRLKNEAAAVPPPPRSIDTLLREGDSFRASGDSGRAMWSYLRAHRADRSDPAPVARIATLHLARDSDRAEALFRELLAQDESNPEAHTGLGMALLAGDELDSAEQSFGHSLEMNPESAAAGIGMGVTLDRLGRPAEARQTYRQVLAYHPRQYQARNNLGVSYLLTEEWAAAAAEFEAAAELEPRDPAVANNLGLALGRLGRDDASLASFERATGRQGAWNNLGYVRYLRGDTEGAIEAYERALSHQGGERLSILRNLRAARLALEEETRPTGESGSEPAPEDTPESAQADPLPSGEVFATQMQIQDTAPPLVDTSSAPPGTIAGE